MRTEKTSSNDIERQVVILTEALRGVCSAETCYPPIKDQWSSCNPFFGHCAVVTEIARRVFGGEILVARIKLATGEAYKHYWNLFPGGREVDMTADQFPDGVEITKGVVKRKKRVSDRETLGRVAILWERICRELGSML